MPISMQFPEEEEREEEEEQDREGQGEEVEKEEEADRKENLMGSAGGPPQACDPADKQTIRGGGGGSNHAAAPLPTIYSVAN